MTTSKNLKKSRERINRNGVIEARKEVERIIYGIKLIFNLRNDGMCINKMVSIVITLVLSWMEIG